MSYDVSYVLCLVSYVFHIAFAYVLAYDYFLMLMHLCFVILISNSTRREIAFYHNNVALSFLVLVLVLNIIHSYINFEKPPHLPADNTLFVCKYFYC